MNSTKSNIKKLEAKPSRIAYRQLNEQRISVNKRIIGLRERVKKMSPVQILLEEKLLQMRNVNRKGSVEMGEFGTLVFTKESSRRCGKSMREQYLEEQGYGTDK